MKTRACRYCAQALLVYIIAEIRTRLSNSSMHNSSTCMFLVLCSGLFLQEALYMVKHREKVRDHVMDARYVTILSSLENGPGWKH